MTAPGRYAAADGSLARSGGNAAARGSALILLAVVIGFVLLWKGGVGGDSAAAPESTADPTGVVDPGADDNVDTSEPIDVGAGEGATDDATAVEPEVTVPVVPDTPVTRPVAEVKAAVANGVGVSGLAGTQSQLLQTAGYTSIGINAAGEPPTSAIYFAAGYEADAAGIATELGGAAVVPQPMPTDLSTIVKTPSEVDGFHVIVVLGADRTLG